MRRKALNILVTGAAGFIGSHLARRLARQGHRVVGVDAFTDYYDPELKRDNARMLVAEGGVMHRADLVTDDLREIVDGIDVVYHAAAQPGISTRTTFEDYLRNNIVATQRLLEAVSDLDGFELFVNISSSSVYGGDAAGDETSEPRPTSAYGVTKLAAEQLVLAEARDRGFPACSCRLFSVYGPRERPDKLIPALIQALLDRRPFPLFEGSEHHRRSYTYVSDIVDGLVTLLGHHERVHGEIVNLGNDRDISTMEVIEIVQRIVGYEVEIERHPRRLGDQLRTRADIAKARALLDYAPCVDPEEGLSETVAWFQERARSASHAAVLR